MYGFELGREFKLSIAEILTVFPSGETIYSDKQILILSGINKEEILNKVNNLGGTIKVFEINTFTQENDIYQYMMDKNIKEEGKYNYSLNLFGTNNKSLKGFLLNSKRFFKNTGFNARFVNKNEKNLTSAQILGNKLIKKETDYNIVDLGNIFYAGKTLWTQDIDSYSKRDWQKDRDMQTGMLPPKLSQMMINLSGGDIIYDPFVGLGTVLIESILMGNKKVYGSDLNEKMVETTKNNIVNFTKEENIEIEDFDIIKLNAKFISESVFFDKGVDAIVTEGYLGEVMTKKNISVDRIEKQKESLILIYKSFFKGLKEINYKGTIVISFPFWEINKKYFYFDNIYNLLEDYCDIQEIFPESFEKMTTKKGSLLYKRDKQLVGREIFKLKIKI